MNDIRRMAVSGDIDSAEQARWNRRIVLVVAFGILLRGILVFGILESMPQMGDGPSYVAQASAVLSGTVDHFYFPPGTAFFTLPVFSIFGFSTFSEHLAGMLIGVLLVASIVFLARTILPSQKAVFIAAVIGTFYPHVLLSTAQISSLPLAAAFVSIAIAFGVRAARRSSSTLWVASAVACGSAVLVRPGTLLLPAVIVVMAWFATDKRSRVSTSLYRPLGIMSLVVTAMCLPVGLFHASGGHGLTLATNSEWNMLLANNAHSPDYKTGHFGQRAIADLDPSAQAYIRQFFTTETAEPATAQQRQRMLDSARAYILGNPGRTLWRMASRVRGFFGCDYTAAREMQLVFGYSDRVFAGVMLLEGGFYLLILLGWLFSMLQNEASIGLSRSFQVALLAAIIAPHVLAFSLAKYHLPFVPVMICCTAAVISHAQQNEKGRTSMFAKRRNTLIILVIAVAVIQVEHLVNLVWYR